MNIWLILRQIHRNISKAHFVSINQIHIDRQARSEGKIPGLSVASAPGSPICLHKAICNLAVQMVQVWHHVRLLADQREAFSLCFHEHWGLCYLQHLPGNIASCCPAPQWEGWGQSWWIQAQGTEIPHSVEKPYYQKLVLKGLLEDTVSFDLSLLMVSV